MLSDLLILAVFCLSSLVEAAPGSVCNSGIYKVLVPLGADPDVRQYCAAHYPAPVVKRGEEAYHLIKRSTKITTTPSTTPKPATSTSKSSSKSITSTACKSCSKVSSLLDNAASIVKTACSCILHPSTTTSKTTSQAAPTTKSTTTPSTTPSTTTTSSSAAKPTTCNSDQSNFCNAQTQNVCRCQLDLDGVTPICSNGAACPQTKFPNPPPPCASDLDCVLEFPGSTYNRCVYTDADFFCTPTYCATEDGCFQQGRTTKRAATVPGNFAGLNLADVRVLRRA